MSPLQNTQLKHQRLLAGRYACLCLLRGVTLRNVQMHHKAWVKLSAPAISASEFADVRFRTCVLVSENVGIVQVD